MTREEYDTLLRAKGYTQYKAGYLPYSIVDGWQQFRKDFAYWRALKKGHRDRGVAGDEVNKVTPAKCGRCRFCLWSER